MVSFHHAGMEVSAQWREQQKEAAKLDAAIEANLKRLGFQESCHE
ncbi:hypothetical protein FACS1894158_04220 [Betaproteobacteria bacterium]|nr:hypothetical protein FACS1894158_04220 [Betaproteobacteria bacterium]